MGFSESQQVHSPKSTKNVAEPIAVIGIGCRFPGKSDSPSAFWDLLTSGKDAIIDVPKDRWDIRKFYDPNPEKNGKMYVRAGGFLQERIDQFDAAFFGISPREAACMDPQQRVLLEVAWEALEDSGQAPDKLAGSDTGVYIGGFTLDNKLTQMSPLNRDLIGTYTPFGFTMAILSNRISYTFDFRGPSLSIDTACSSSLVAFNSACESLRSGESSLALAGGVNIMFRPELTMGMCKGHFLAPDGHCKSFDERADGYARAEGAGITVLKPLSAALRDGDKIYALVRGSGVNQDGRTKGISVPNPDAQEQLIRKVYRQANVDPKNIRYFEAHGTGTAVGDPIEAKALGSVVGKDRDHNNACLLGSVKANIGHLEAAAGIAGVIKAALCLKHQQIPPLANLTNPNPKIPFKELGLRLPTTLEPMPQGTGPALIGVNSFGYGGTNAHAVMEQPPLAMLHESISDKTNFPHMLVISARSNEALNELSKSYSKQLTDHSDKSLRDLCYSSSTRRAHLSHRLAVTGESAASLIQELQTYVKDGYSEHVSFGSPLDNSKPVFVFTGMGPQWWGMGRELLKQSSVFRDKAEECDEIFKQISGWSILAEMLADEQLSRMNNTQVAQPANFVIQASLTALLNDKGITPAAVIGHSVGEVTATYVAGVLSLEEALRVSFHRSRVQKKAAGLGAMLAVGLPEHEALNLLSGHTGKVSIAAINSPSSVTLSGEQDALTEIAAIAETRGHFNRFLDVEVAYHSHYMDPLKSDLLESLSDLNPQLPTIPLYSTVTGGLIKHIAYDANYWYENIRKPVYFSKAMESLIGDNYKLLLEVGPHPVLSVSIKECLSNKGVYGKVIASLRRKKPEIETFSQAIAELHTLGCPIDWERYYPTGGNYVPLPLYPWQRETHWQETEQSRTDRIGHSGHVLLGQRLPNPTPVWENTLNRNYLPYIDDHHVEGLQVLPGAAYVELGLAIHQQITEKQECILENLDFQQALVIDDNDEVTIRCSYNEKIKSYSVHSRINQDNADWSLHATGNLSMSTLTTAGVIDLAAIRARCTKTQEGKEHYQNMQQLGLDYGPYFQGVKRLWLNPDQQEVLAQIQGADELGEHRLHPALFDACLQAFLASFDIDDVHVPVSIKKIRFRASPSSRLWCYGQCTKQTNGTVEGNITIVDDSGSILVEATGVVAQALTNKNGESDNVQTQHYHFDWQQEALASSAKQTGNWLVFKDTGTVGDQLFTQIPSAKISISTADSYKKLDASHYEIRRDSKEDLRQVLVDAQLETCQHIVYLWGLDASENPEDPIGINTVVHGLQLIQFMGQSTLTTSPHLHVITRDAQPVSSSQKVNSLDQTPLVGLLRVALNEYPELGFSLIDLDPNQDNDNPATLYSEITAQQTEEEVAFRGKDRYVHRLNQIPADQLSTTAKRQQSKTPNPKDAFTLEIGKLGMLDGLRYRETKRRKPGPNEIEIEMHASALNFKDVLKVMDMLPPAAIQDTYFGTTLGMEATGVISRIGKKIKDVAVGDEIVATMCNSFSSHVTVPIDDVFLMPKPTKFSHQESAGLPAVFVTAFYGLHQIARLQPGEKVLIQAAGGGVGLAAIQVAQWIGAEVFATAGSPEKHAYLRSLGIEHIMDSRSTEFADQIMAITNGKGVDVVLNSIAGETINKNLSVLSSFGRCIEIGKRDIVENNPLGMLPFNRNLTFAAVDIDRMMAERPEQYRQLLNEVWQRFEAGDFTPIPIKVFPASETIEAFQYMAKSKQIGKVVVTMNEHTNVQVLPAIEEKVLFEPKASYLITGGLGGFGLEMAKWMIQEGAKNIALVGRRGAATVEAQDAVKQLKRQGANVLVCARDISHEWDVKQLLDEISEAMPPLKGVWHAAGAIDDAPLSELNMTRFETVMKPKALGAWHLHKLTKNLPLTHFVLFSSIAAQLGSPGQGAYAAANNFLDSLAHHRRSAGLAATSVNWGALAKVGMVARHGELEKYLEQIGMHRLNPSQATKMLGEALKRNETQITIADINWKKWANAHAMAATSKRFSHLIAEQEQNQSKVGQNELVVGLMAMAEEQRASAVTKLLVEQVAETMRLAVNKIDSRQSLTAMGIESLMAMELQAAIGQKLSIKVSVLDLMRGSSIEKLGATLALRITESAQQTPVVETIEPASNTINIENSITDINVDAELDLARLEEMTDEQVGSLLEELALEEKA